MNQDDTIIINTDKNTTEISSSKSSPLIGINPFGDLKDEAKSSGNLTLDMVYKYIKENNEQTQKTIQKFLRKKSGTIKLTSQQEV